MIVKDFESAIIKKGLKPIHLFMQKGRQVKWFLCIETENRKFSGIVYDSEGKAYAIPAYHKPIENEENVSINVVDGDVMVNCVSTVRVPFYDINDTQNHH